MLAQVFIDDASMPIVNKPLRWMDRTPKSAEQVRLQHQLQGTPNFRPQ